MSNKGSLKQDYQRYKKYFTDIRRIAGQAVFQESFTVVLSLFLVSFFIVFALRPTFVKIAELRVQIETSEKTLTQLQVKTQSLSRAADLWNEITPYREQLNASIPVGPAYVEFVKEVEALSARHGVAYEGASFASSLITQVGSNFYSPEKPLEGIAVPYTVRVSGSYPNLINFLKDFRMIDRVVSFENVGFSRETQRGQVGATKVTMNLSGESYYFGNKREIEEAIKEIGGK